MAFFPKTYDPFIVVTAVVSNSGSDVMLMESAIEFRFGSPEADVRERRDVLCNADTVSIMVRPEQMRKKAEVGVTPISKPHDLWVSRKHVARDSKRNW